MLYLRSDTLPGDEPMYEDHGPRHRYVGQGDQLVQKSHPTILEEEDEMMYVEHEPHPRVAREGALVRGSHPSSSEQDYHVMYDEHDNEILDNVRVRTNPQFDERDLGVPANENGIYSPYVNNRKHMIKTLKCPTRRASIFNTRALSVGCSRGGFGSRKLSEHFWAR